MTIFSEYLSPNNNNNNSSYKDTRTGRRPVLVHYLSSCNEAIACGRRYNITTFYRSIRIKIPAARAKMLRIWPIPPRLIKALNPIRTK